ncbi:transporter [Pseudomonas aeruginosa]|uniref:SphA family protein n=1 Tax=Pseudomonas aeruginosa TaxID=287 RepID=UPI000F51F70A|nr:transporter [Pseudomonas aeruginosa]RQB77657.1 phenol degradation protein [Pseudomonas aeruginosa]
MAISGRLRKCTGLLSLLAPIYTLADPMSLPALTLGNTSFVDGIAGPGLLYEQVLNHYRANRLKDAHGHEIPGSQKVRVTALVSHAAYITEQRILGGYYGFEAIVPIVHTHLDFDGGPSGERTRLGDVAVSPIMLQWDPVSLLGRPFWQRLNLTFTLPTGSYSKNASVNTGANLWQVNPHYAFTWELTERLEFSGRLHYAWFSKNRRPTDALQASNIQPGDAWHGNYSLSYAITPEWRIGIAGYNLRQIHPDRIDGHRQNDSKEKVWGIGPGIMYRKAKDIIYLNAYNEHGATNASEGSRFNLRYIHLF